MGVRMISNTLGTNLRHIFSIFAVSHPPTMATSTEPWNPVSLNVIPSSWISMGSAFPLPTAPAAGRVLLITIRPNTNPSMGDPPNFFAAE